MATNPNDAAKAQYVKTRHFGEVAIEKGLTKREYFAAMVLQGLATRDLIGDIERRVETSVKYADALIEELNKENN